MPTDLTTPPTEPGEGFRLLDPNELTIEGDECWASSWPKWRLARNWNANSGRQADNHMYRRRIEQPAPPSKLPNQSGLWTAYCGPPGFTNRMNVRIENSETFVQMAESWDAGKPWLPLSDFAHWTNWKLVEQPAPMERNFKPTPGSLVEQLRYEHQIHQTVFDDDRRRKALFLEAADKMDDSDARVRKLEGALKELAWYAGTVRTDRLYEDGELAAQTVDWCNGLVELADKAKQMLPRP